MTNKNRRKMIIFTVCKIFKPGVECIKNLRTMNYAINNESMLMINNIYKK